MKKAKKERIISSALPILTAILCVLLLILSAVLIYMIRESNTSSEGGFSLDKLTSSESVSKADISQYMLPEFIGITVDGRRVGMTSSPNIMAELYSSVSPILSSLISEENMTEGNTAMWERMTREKSSIYFRYRNSYPDMLIAVFADASAGEDRARNEVGCYVYEMFLGMYSDSDDSITALVRDTAGGVFVYTLKSPTVTMTSIELGRFVRTYASAVKDFVFAGDGISAESVTEPLFASPLVTKQIMLTDTTSGLAKSTREHLIMMLELFSINPDKLQNTFTDADGGTNYVGARGVFRIGLNSLEYKSTSETGITCRDLIGGSGKLYIRDYLTAAVHIISRIESMSKYYTGGDARLYCDSVNSSGDRVEICFGYAMDNIKIANSERAFTLVFENGILESMKLDTVSSKAVGSLYETADERAFAYSLSTERRVRSIGLVYKNRFYENNGELDYVFPEWCAEYVKAAEGETEAEGNGRRAR